MLNSIKISIALATTALVMSGCAAKGGNHHCSTFIETGKCSGIMHGHMPTKVAPVVDGDTDDDGVLNSMDKCPGTSPYAKVDAKGCMIVAEAVVDGDDDKDGVLNSMDKCPNTMTNVTKVDMDGCAVAVNLQVQFEFDSYEVTTDSITNIVNFGNFMNDHGTYKANIVGHTDASGPADYNQMLSQKRAEVVAGLITSKGNVAASRLTAIGKGESTPLVSNETKEGRVTNRRTEAHIVK